MVPLKKYVKNAPINSGSRSNKIAIVYLDGNIMDAGNLTDEIISTKATVKILKKIAKDSKVKSIVLRINSPGGSSLASDMIWREIRKIEKPVVASIGSIAASGGYYLAMGAEKIVADSLSITGSIGVFMGKFNISQLLEKIGVKQYKIAEDKNGINLFDMSKNFSKKERKLLQNHLNLFYKRFISKVANSRNMSLEEVDKIAQGRVWMGAAAVENGLVDEIGGLQAAINMAKDLGDIPQHIDPYLKVYPQKVSLLEKFTDQNSVIEAKFDKVKAEINYYLNTHIFAEMPYIISVD
jgi:protease-4